MIRRDCPLVLGSASPRRLQILTELGIPVLKRPGHSAEAERAGESPADFLERVAAEKLASVIPLLEGQSFAGILVADTIVVVDGEILGKPRDLADARRLLGRIVGRTHTVYTRYLICKARTPAEEAQGRTVATQVTMRAVSPDVIAAYAATGEGLDKAGAYAAQGIGTFLIARIEGSYTNVVGLPACEVIEDLCRLGLLERYP